jgi:cytochrome c biogenesis protein CcdA
MSPGRPCVVLYHGRMRFLLLLAASVVLAAGATAGATAGEAAVHAAGSVRVTVSLDAVADGRAVVVGRFVPDLLPTPHHIYPLDVPADAIGQGVATGIEVEAPLVADGPATADVQPIVAGGSRVLPEGPVTVRLPVHLPAGDGTPMRVGVLLTYMACTADGYCKQPVRRARVELAVPTLRSTATGAAVDPAVVRAAVAAELDARAAGASADLRSAVETGVRAELDRRDLLGAGIHWLHPATVAEAEAAIVAAKAAGRRALLDFTGPSCSNCQVMKQGPFTRAAVRSAWNAGVAISLDTDRHPELGRWQVDRFRSDSRPLYVRIDPDGGSDRWTRVWTGRDDAAEARLAEFLRGGPGDDVAATGLAGLLVLAVLGGLATLLMPCTYPMIPFTLNVFAKQQAAGRRLLPLALAYGAGIIVCFVAVGAAIAGPLHASLGSFTGNPVLNLVVALLFIVLGLGLLGAFFLHLPPWLEDAVGGSKAGYVGALLMGLTFAITGFTCAAPVAGAVLAQAATGGSWGVAILAMTVYASAIAVPFVALALAPGLLKRLPRAGAWMHEVQVVGGLVELGAALKFLVTCDAIWGWGVFTRGTVLAAWAGLGIVAALYLLGRIRLDGDSPVAVVAPLRLLLATVFLAAGLAALAGLAGGDLGVIEGFFPR